MAKQELLDKARECLPGADWKEVSGESYFGYETLLFSGNTDDYLGVYIMDDDTVESAHGLKVNPKGSDPFSWLREELVAINTRVDFLLNGAKQT